MRIFMCLAAMGFAFAVLGNSVNADIISVNFHVGDDQMGQADHEFDGTETAGAGVWNTSAWNNVDVGAGGNNAAGTIFPSTTVTGDSGGSATLATSGGTGTWFGGYAASAASVEDELPSGGTDTNLFNSYLALNVNGDGTPNDGSQLIDISALSSAYTANGYSLVIYGDSDRRGNGTAVRQSVYTVTPTGGAGVPVNVQDDEAAVPGTAIPTFDGTYLQSSNSAFGVAEYSNYTVISGLTASGFTIGVNSPDGGRGAISGFQIVANTAVPEPSSLLALGVLGLGLATRRRRS